MGVSVVLAVKNEQDNLKKCLKRVIWADEIIIIDNGSSDNTVAIAKEFTTRIYHYPTPLLIPELQQYGIDKASQEWVLVLDADVIVPEQAKMEILKKIKDTRFVGYYLHHQMVAFGKPMKYALNCDILKLFKKKYGKFDGSGAHCIIKIKGAVGLLNTPLLHYSHPTLTHFIKKMNLYTSQDAEKIMITGKGGLLNKRMKRIGIYNLIIEPFLYANYLFFVKKYSFDGMYGVVLSAVMGFYLFIERAKTLELMIRSRQRKK